MIELKNKRIRSALTLVVMCISLWGCATPNLASIERDAQAKSFAPDPGTAALYIYRNENFGGAISMPVTLNGKTLGETGPKTYFKVNVPTGEHTITGQGENLSVAKVSTEAGKNYFIWQEIKMGLITARNQLKQVIESVGREGVLESKLLISLDSDSFHDLNQGSRFAQDNKKEIRQPAVEVQFLENSIVPAEANRLSNKKALVIGNDSYKTAPRLIAAREDARTIASNLKSVGYQVTLRLDLNEKEMKSAMRAFAAQVQGGDEVVFFFAGHGVQLGTTNYLLPTDIVGDSEAQVRDEAIQLQRVLDDMSEKKAKFTLAMIDACRDNPFKSAGRTIGGRGLAPTTAATGQMVIFSAGTGQQALDRLGNSDRNKNGLFTRVFVQEMQKQNVSIDRVVKNVRNQVAELAKSVGHEQVPAIYDQVLGDFYFKK